MTPINMLVLLFCCISMRELMYLVNNSFESKGGFNWKTLRSDNHTTIWIIAYPKLSRILTTYCGAQIQDFFLTAQRTTLTIIIILTMLTLH